MPFPKAWTEPPGFSPSLRGLGVRRESLVARFCYRLKNEPYTNLQDQSNQTASRGGGRSSSAKADQPRFAHSPLPARPAARRVVVGALAGPMEHRIEDGLSAR